MWRWTIFGIVTLGHLILMPATTLGSIMLATALGSIMPATALGSIMPATTLGSIMPATTLGSMMPATGASFVESSFLLDPVTHILSLTWTRPESWDHDLDSGKDCGQVTVYEKFFGPELNVTPGEGDFYNCSYNTREGMDILVANIDIISFKVKQFRTYRVCVQVPAEEACTRKFSIETPIPHRRRKKKDPFVETTFHLDSYTHQLSLEWTRKTAGIPGSCVQLDLLEKFLGPQKLLTSSKEDNYQCEYHSKDGVDSLIASIDLASYKVRQFRSYTVCARVEDGQGGREEKACTRSFSVETVVPYSEDTTVVPYSEDTTVVPYSEDTEVVPYIEDTTVVPYSEDTTVVPYSEDTMVVPYSEDSTVVPYSEDTTVVPYSEDTAVVPYSEDSTVVPYIEDSTVMTYSEDTTVVSYSEGKTAVPYSEDTTVVPYIEDTAVVPYSGDSTVVPYSEDTTVVSYSEDTMVVSYSEDTMGVPYSEDIMAVSYSGNTKPNDGEPSLAYINTDGDQYEDEDSLEIKPRIQNTSNAQSTPNEIEDGLKSSIGLIDNIMLVDERSGNDSFYYETSLLDTFEKVGHSFNNENAVEAHEADQTKNDLPIEETELKNLIQYHQVQQLSHNNIREKENNIDHFEDGSKQVKNTVINNAMEVLEKQVDHTKQNKSPTQNSSENVYLVIMMIFLHYQR